MQAKMRRERPHPGGADFRLLGPVEVVFDGRALVLGGVKQRALLALFVLHANEVLSRDFLIDELWGERAPASAAHSIVVYVSRLRKALQAVGSRNMPMLGTEAGGYVLRVEPEQIDVQRFERAVERGGRALAAGAATDAADILRSACAEWRGEPLSDLVSAPFAQGASWRLAELRLAALEARIDADLALGRHVDLVGELELLLRGNPLNERLAAQLMVALYRSGRQAKALEVYRATRRFLVDELGIEPAEELQRLEQAILRHDPALAAPASGSAGRALLPSPSTARPGPIRPQRKTVSVLVARVHQVAHGERADPEALRLSMARYFSVMNAAIERHGGTVERFVDDATLGIFGVPMLHEDDALRAVRASAEMRDAVASLTEVLARERGVALELRVGVDTGRLLTGADGLPVRGEAISVAAALGQAAQAGEILLGAETVRMSVPFVETELHLSVAIPGEPEPMKAFRFRRLAPAGQRPGGPLLDFVFVGRAAELKELQVAFDQAVAERSPRLVTVVGEPGIGKTRLLAEFTSGLAGEARVLGGRCLPYGDGVTYWPIVGAVRELGGPEALARRVASCEQGARLRDLILGAVGACDQIGSVEETHWAIRRLFEALGREKPLIIVLDDLHWAEPTFLQLVEYLVSYCSGSPILLLAAAREELLETRPAWALPSPNTQILPLRALDEPEARVLLDQSAARSGLSEARRARIAEAAAGNPLFLAQLLADQTEPGGPCAELVLPPTIEALLAARLDRLPTAERDLLDRAAVEGTVFHRGALTAMLPADERAEAGAHLLSAIRRNLVRPHPAEIPGEDGFQFVHVLVRDAVYASMPKELRAQLHEHFADWLEEHGRTLLELDEVLGYHLEQAARYRRELAQSDDDLAVRAGDRLAAAGRRALWRGDDGAASSLLGRALELTRPLRRDVHLEVDMAYAVGIVAPQRAAMIAEAAAAQARAAGDEPGEALARLACVYHRQQTRQSDIDEVEAHARSALALLDRVEDHAGLARVWETLAFDVANARERFEEMADACVQALRHAGSAGQPPGDALYQLALALAFGPRPTDEALRSLEALLPDDPGPGLLMLRAYLLAMLDRLDEARPSPWRLCELAREIGGGIGEGMAAEIATLEGDHETAARYLRTMCDVLEERGQRSYLSSWAPLLGRSLCALGRYDEAEPLARLGRELGDERDVMCQMLWRQVQARVAARRGEHEEAERLACEAVAIGEQTDSLNEQARALFDLAEVLRAAGKKAEAAGALAQALERYERKKNLPMARRVRALLTTDYASSGAFSGGDL